MRDYQLSSFVFFSFFKKPHKKKKPNQNQRATSPPNCGEQNEDKAHTGSKSTLKCFNTKYKAKAVNFKYSIWALWKSWVSFLFFNSLKNDPGDNLPYLKDFSTYVHFKYICKCIYIKGKRNTALQAEQTVAFSLKWILNFWISFVPFIKSVWIGNLKNQLFIWLYLLKMLARTLWDTKGFYFHEFGTGFRVLSNLSGTSVGVARGRLNYIKLIYRYLFLVNRTLVKLIYVKVKFDTMYKVVDSIRQWIL